MMSETMVLTKVATALILVAALGAGTAAAQISLPFTDGFENIPVGAYPGANGWEVMYSGYGAAVSDAAAYSGSKSFRLLSTGWGRVDYIPLSLGEIPDRLTYELSLYVPAEAPSFLWAGFSSPKGASAWQTNAFMIDTRGGLNRFTFGTWYFDRPATEPLVDVGAYTPGTWATLRANLDFQNLQGDLWVNGDLRASGVPIKPTEWVHPEAGNLVSDKWALCCGPGDVYFDDISIAPWMEVAVDVRPHQDANRINTKSSGALQVAILGSETLDVNDVDIASLALDGAALREKGSGDLFTQYKDVNKDGYLDLLARFTASELLLDPGAMEIELTGSLLDGTPIFGSDAFTLGGGGQYAALDDSGSVAIPEPATLFLLGLGTLGLMTRLRQRASGRRPGKLRRMPLAAIVVLLVAALGQSGELHAAALLSDDFSSLDSSVWRPATGLPYYVGTPQSVTPTTVDGRNALQMRSDMTKYQRRGYLTVSTFDLAESRVELDFKTIGGIDGLMELWVYDPVGGGYMSICLHGGHYGARPVVIARSNYSGDAWSPEFVWDYGQWYRFAIDAEADRTHLSLRGLDDTEIWGHTYGVSLSSLGGQFAIGIAQFMHIPVVPSHAEAAVDRILARSLSEPLEVPIDVKPGSDPNGLNLRAKGVLPVAILGSETFDVHDVDQSSLQLEGSTPKERGKSGIVGAYDDVNEDGFLDLVARFGVADLALDGDATEVELTGLLLDGTEILGTDAVKLAGGSGYLTLDDTGSVAIPEPATLTLLAIGAAAMLWRKRKPCR